MRLSYPTLKLILYLIKRLQELYPEDYIRLYRLEALELTLHNMKYVGCQYKKTRYRLAAKAASLLYDLVTLHPLTDGNKRLAVWATGAFLMKNGYYVPKSTMFKLALLIARTEIDKEETYKWLLKRLKPLDRLLGKKQ